MQEEFKQLDILCHQNIEAPYVVVGHDTAGRPLVVQPITITEPSEWTKVGRYEHAATS
jgi:hypothetical protein